MLAAAKEDIKRLQLAWQMRIDLDSKEIARQEAALVTAQEELGRWVDTVYYSRYDALCSLRLSLLFTTHSAVASVAAQRSLAGG